MYFSFLFFFSFIFQTFGLFFLLLRSGIITSLRSVTYMFLIRFYYHHTVVVVVVVVVLQFTAKTCADIIIIISRVLREKKSCK